MSKREFPLPERDKDGGFPAFTSVGCYTLIYYTDHGDALCAQCASQTHLPADPALDAPATMCDVYWEGPTEYCANCDAPIESSYGDPDPLAGTDEGRRDHTETNGRKVDNE